MKQLLLTNTELSYVNYYIKKEARLGIATIIILALFVSGLLLPAALVEIGLTLFGGQFDFHSGSGWESMSRVFISVCVLAYLLPLYLFRFKMNRSGNDLYLSLPIERKRLFYVHYVIGLFYLITISLLLLIGYSVFVKALSIYQITSAGSFSYILLNIYFIGLGVCLYTFFTYIVIRCYNLLDAILMELAYTLLPLLFYYALQALIIHAAEASTAYLFLGFDDASLLNMIELPTAVLSIPTQMNLWMLYYCSYASEAVIALELLLVAGLLWIIFAVCCFLGARRSFVRIRSEQSGQNTNAFFTYPLLIPLVSFLLLIATQSEQLFSISIIFILVAYLLAHFIAYRKISFSIRKLLLFFSLAASSFLLFISLTKTNLFGALKEVPKLENVNSFTLGITQYDANNESPQTTFLSGSGSSDEALADILREQAKIRDYKKQHSNNEFYDQAYIVRFQYDSDTAEQGFIERTYIFNQEDREYIEARITEWKKNNIIQNYTV